MDMNKLGSFFLSFLIALGPSVGHAAPGFFSEEMVEYKGSTPEVTHKKARLPDRFNGRRGHYMDAFYDPVGRLSMIQSRNGNQYVLIYDHLFTGVPSKILVNGEERSLPLKPAVAKVVDFERDDDYDTLVNEYQGFLELYGENGCAMTCVGISDNLTDFMTYIGGGAALGALIGAVLAQLAGANAAELMFAMGLGSASGAAFFFSYGAGHAFGTWLYNTATNAWYYKPGSP
jgi:hypothetical protein